MTGFAAAECGIRQLQARYTDAVWRRDLAVFGDYFTEDAEWHVADFEDDNIEGATVPRTVQVVVKGRDKCVRFFGHFFDHMNRILMTFPTPILQVTGPGMAVGRCYSTEQVARKDKVPMFSTAIYYDRFVQQGDRWRFAWRYFQLQYTGPPDLAGQFLNPPDPGPPFAMPDGTTSKPARIN
jgi:hypothetical protein